MMEKAFDDPNGLVKAIKNGAKIRLDDLKNAGWESPIRAAVQTLSTQIDDALVMEVRQAIGIDVDKERLIDALNYSHQSWLDGYAAGLRYCVKPGHWQQGHETNRYGIRVPFTRCSECKVQPPTTGVFDDYILSDYCPNCGAYMRTDKGVKADG